MLHQQAQSQSFAVVFASGASKLLALQVVSLCRAESSNSHLDVLLQECLFFVQLASEQFSAKVTNCVREQLLVDIPCMTLQDFSEAADALGSLNLSEGWSSLSLRSRHSESGAQDAELRAQRGDPFEDSRSHREAGQEQQEDQYGSAQSVSQYEAPLLWCLRQLDTFRSLLLPADMYHVWTYTY